MIFKITKIEKGLISLLIVFITVTGVMIGASVENVYGQASLDKDTVEKAALACAVLAPTQPQLTIHCTVINNLYLLLNSGVIISSLGLDGLIGSVLGGGSIPAINSLGFLPYGGPVVTLPELCCNGGFVHTVNDYAQGGAPRRYLWIPGGAQIYQFYQMGRPGVNHVGLYQPTPGICSEAASACIGQLPFDGIIIQAGTSL